MPTDSTHSILAAVNDKLRLLNDERIALLTGLREVDRKIASIASVLNIDIESPQPEVDLDELRARRRGRTREGTITEFVIKALALAPPEGLSRHDLNAQLASSEFAERHRQSPNNLYNIIARGLHRGEIAERNRRLFHSTRVPPEPTAEGPANLLPFPQGSNRG